MVLHSAANPSLVGELLHAASPFVASDVPAVGVDSSSLDGALD